MSRILVFISFSCIQLVYARAGLTTEKIVPDEPELIFANVLFRHGDRNIGVAFEKDPYGPLKYWPEGYSMLTNVGKQQQFALGQYLRKRYQKLLDKESGKNVNDVIYVQSTNYDQTLMSAAANLAGMFPPTRENVWNSGLRWQPIPIHTAPKEVDHILSWSRPCPRYKVAYSAYKNASNYQSLYTKYGPLLRYLQLHTGNRIRDFFDVWDLYDCLKLEQMRNFTLPEWTKNVYPGGDMEYLTLRTITHGSETPEMSRLKMGFFLKEILDRFQSKIESKLSPDRSIWMYSAHDSTVSILLKSLGLFEPHMPPFCATVFLELYKLRDQFYIQILYKNSSADPLQMNIPSCGPMCPIDRFYEIYEAIIPTGSFEEECSLDSDEPESPFHSIEKDILLIACLVAGLCIKILIGLMLSWKLIHRREIDTSKISGNSFYHTHHDPHLPSVHSFK